jgi:hypothetical protein
VILIRQGVSRQSRVRTESAAFQQISEPQSACIRVFSKKQKNENETILLKNVIEDVHLSVMLVSCMHLVTSSNLCQKALHFTVVYRRFCQNCRHILGQNFKFGNDSTILRQSIKLCTHHSKTYAYMFCVRAVSRSIYRK